MFKQVRLVSAILVATLLLAGCGGGAGQSASTHLTVQMTEFSFQPASFTVPAGKEITLELSNTGSVEHSFVIMNLGTQAASPFGDADAANVYWQVVVQPGDSTSATFTAPTQPGDYQVVCKEPGHLEAGMTAKLTVVQP
jgi:uncharacterized cupredoxin-like copper-binding protein